MRPRGIVKHFNDGDIPMVELQDGTILSRACDDGKCEACPTEGEFCDCTCHQCACPDCTCDTLINNIGDVCESCVRKGHTE